MSASAQVTWDAQPSASGVKWDNAPSQFLQPPQGLTSIAPAPKPFTLPWLKQKFYDMAVPGANALPAAGATVGSVIGGAGGTLAEPGGGSALGAVGGAGVGGMAGEAGKQLLNTMLYGQRGAPPTSQQAMGDISKQGIGQAAAQGLVELLPFLSGPLKNAATSQYERALAPTTKINKAITQEIAPQMIDRGLSGSLEGMQGTAEKNIAQLNPELNNAYQQAASFPTSSGTLPAKVQGAGDQVISDLENIKQTYMPEGKVAQPQAVSAIQGVQDLVKQYGSDIDPNTLRRLRQIFEEVPAQKGAYAGADLSTNYTLNAQQAAADSIRGILNSNPDIGALNKEISFWLDVQRVTRDSGLRQTGQEGGLLKSLWPLGAAVAGGAAGATHSAEAGAGAAASTFLATQAAKAIRSPAWRTLSAVAKDRFAEALASGNVGAVSALVGRFGLGAVQSLPQSTQAGLPWLRQPQQLGQQQQ